jgi:type IX secretion system PorP/SprF family membrane protein
MLGILFSPGKVSGQQRPQYALYFQNNYVLNPAIGGIEDFTDVKLSYRKQWVGITGSPVTSYLSVQGPLGDPSKGHGGLGLLLVGDRTGPDSRLTFNGSYSYHVPITSSIRVSLGISGGLTQYILNTNGLIFGQGSLTDPAVGANRAGQYVPDLVAGVWIYSPTFYIGGSMNQLIPSQLSFGSLTKNTNERLRAHGFITSGVKLKVADEVNFTPSVMVKFISPAPISFDINGKFLYKDYLWMGGSIRRGDGFTVALGMNLSSLVNVSYAYDYTTSALQKYTSGSHEIILGLQLGNHSKVRCPKMLW